MLVKEKKALQLLKDQGHHQVSIPLTPESLAKIFSLRLNEQGQPVLVVDVQDLAGIEFYNKGERFTVRSNNNLFIDSDHERGKTLHLNSINRDGSPVRPVEQVIDITKQESICQQ